MIRVESSGVVLRYEYCQTVALLLVVASSLSGFFFFWVVNREISHTGDESTDLNPLVDYIRPPTDRLMAAAAEKATHH